MVEFLITSIVGGLSTYFLSNYSSLSAVKSSIIATLLFLIVFHVWSSFHEANEQLQSVFFGASFVGMSGKKIINWIEALLASALYAFALFYALPYFGGMGGALGTSAAITVITVYLCKIAVKKLNQKNVE